MIKISRSQTYEAILYLYVTIGIFFSVIASIFNKDVLKELSFVSKSGC